MIRTGVSPQTGFPREPDHILFEFFFPGFGPRRFRVQKGDMTLDPNRFDTDRHRTQEAKNPENEKKERQ